MSQATFESLLHAIGPGHVVGFFLVLARVSPLFVLAPLFSSQMVPPQVRGIVAVALSMGLTLPAMHGQTIPTDPLTLSGALAVNLLVGLAFSFAVNAVFAGIQAAGALLDLVSGFSYGAVIDPFDGNQGGILMNFYTVVGLAMFIAVGGDAWTLRGLDRTLRLVPLTGSPHIASLTAGAVSAFGSVFVSALEVAAPAMLALLITDVGFGMVSKVVPQLNVFGVGFPLKVGVALLIVGAALPFLGGFMSNQIASAVTTALQTL